jgi:hypothetical protein
MAFHHERRLDRALHHLDSLKAEVRAWADERPYRTWSDFDVNNLYKLTWLEVLDPPPIELSPIIGDCIHNLRAALDNLVYELALAHHGGRVPPDFEVKLQFPIFDHSAKFASKGKNMIGGIAPAAQAIIEELQPYHREDTFRKDRLWQLHWLDIEDKHRLPHVVLFAQMGTAYFVPDNLTIDDIEPIFSLIERRAPIARYPAFDETGAEVDVQPTPSLSIRFGQRVPQQLRAMPIPTRLMFIHHHIVNSVLPPLRPFLTGH